MLSITRAEFGTAAKSAPESGTSTAAKGTGTAVTFIASSSSTHPHVNSRVGVSGSASASVNRAPDGSNRNDSAPAFSQQAGAGEVAHKRLNNTDTKLLYDLLPGETEVGRFPVALIMNAFDPLVNSTADAGDSSDYFEELEVGRACGLLIIIILFLIILILHYCSNALSSSLYIFVSLFL